MPKDPLHSFLQIAASGRSPQTLVLLFNLGTFGNSGDFGNPRPISVITENQWYGFCLPDLRSSAQICGKGSSSPCLRDEGLLFRSVSSLLISGKVLLFRSPDHRCPDHPISCTTLLSSITSSGHSSQLCFQHTIMSHPLGSCRCRKKLRLSYSNSILTGCHLSTSTSLIA